MERRIERYPLGPTQDEKETKGVLAPIAARVLMKILFAARMARYDLLRAVQGLAARVTKWSDDCDKALFRLTLNLKLQIADADHARNTIIVQLVDVSSFWWAQTTPLRQVSNSLFQTWPIWHRKRTLYQSGHWYQGRRPPQLAHLRYL